MITVNEVARGSGGVYLISGTNHDEVRSKAQEIRQGIDFMRSPMISESIKNTGELLCEVKYYGLD
jgi:hypothetical protein